MSVLEIQKVVNDCCDRCIEREAYKDARSVSRTRFGDTFGDILLVIQIFSQSPKFHLFHILIILLLILCLIFHLRASSHGPVTSSINFSILGLLSFAIYPFDK
jgi:hypothetical protein